MKAAKLFMYFMIPFEDTYNRNSVTKATIQVRNLKYPRH